MTTINALTTGLARTGALIALAAAFAPLTPASAQMGDQPPVEIGQARVTTMSPTMKVAGTVVSRSDAVISAEVEGRLVEVADVGTPVEPGDVIARIEDRSLRLQLDQLEAEQRRVEARLDYLEAELDRVERLAETNLAAASQIDQTRSERNVAAADLNVIESRIAQLDDQIDRTRISAPFAGTVVERLAREGERVGVGTNVARLVDPEDLEVIARAPLVYYRYVRPGQSLGVHVGEEHLTDAPVRTAVSVGDETRHVFEMRLNLDARLPVGQTVRVTVPTAEPREVLAVPRDALVLRGDGTSVFVVDEGGTARRVAVEPGIGEGEWIEVDGSISEGDRVVIRGNERLRAGQSVRVLEG